MLDFTTYKGYTIKLNGTSFSCIELGIYGYGTELSIKRAITRKIRKSIH